MPTKVHPLLASSQPNRLAHASSFENVVLLLLFCLGFYAYMHDLIRCGSIPDPTDCSGGSRSGKPEPGEWVLWYVAIVGFRGVDPSDEI